MLSHTLCLDLLILASATFPSGVSGSLASVLRMDTRRVTTAFLVLILAPFVVVLLAALSVRHDLFLMRSSYPWVLALALIAAPATLVIEWGIHNAVAWARSGRFLHAIALHGFWQGRRSAIQFALLVLIAFAEEVVFRQIWIGVLEHTFGFAPPAALIASATIYAVNHLHFGWSAVLAKFAAGLVYGGLFLLDDRSIWSPFLAHALQNAILLSVPAKHDD